LAWAWECFFRFRSCSCWEHSFVLLSLPAPTSAPCSTSSSARGWRRTAALANRATRARPPWDASMNSAMGTPTAPTASASRMLSAPMGMSAVRWPRRAMVPSYASVPPWGCGWEARVASNSRWTNRALARQGLCAVGRTIGAPAPAAWTHPRSVPRGSSALTPRPNRSVCPRVQNEDVPQASSASGSKRAPPCARGFMAPPASRCLVPKASGVPCARIRRSPDTRGCAVSRSAVRITRPVPRG
jgi:hypothetical protein